MASSCRRRITCWRKVLWALEQMPPSGLMLGKIRICPHRHPCSEIIALTSRWTKSESVPSGQILSNFKARKTSPTSYLVLKVMGTKLFSLTRKPVTTRILQRCLLMSTGGLALITIRRMVCSMSMKPLEAMEISFTRSIRKRVLWRFHLKSSRRLQMALWTALGFRRMEFCMAMMNSLHSAKEHFWLWIGIPWRSLPDPRTVALPMYWEATLTRAEMLSG